MTARTRSNFYPTALATFVAGLSLSAVCAWWSVHNTEARVNRAVDELVQDTVAAVFNRVQLYQYGLRGARGAVLVAGERGLNRELFKRYSESRDIATEFPGARGFGFIRRVAPADEAAFLAKARAEAAPGEAFNPRLLQAHDSDRLFIEYIEPDGPNSAAVGFDIASEPHRAKAAQEAIDTGELRLTQPITLMQAPSKAQQSFLILMPVYRHSKTPDSVEERRRQLIGLTYAPLLMSDVLEDLRIDDRLLHVQLSDMSDGSGTPSPFFDNYESLPVRAGLYPRRFEHEIFGRRWRFELSVTQAFVARQGVIAPAYFWIGGLLASLLLASLAGAIAVSRAQRREIAYARMELGAIVESASDAIIGKDLNGVVRSWNRGAERLFGFSASEAIGRPITDLVVSPEQAREETEMLARIARGEPVSHYDTLRMHKNGTPLQVSLTPAPVHDANGQVVGASVTARDIALQKAQNDALQEQVHHSQATTQAILDTVVDPVLSIDRDGTVLSINPAGSQVFGYATDQVVGEHVTRLIPKSHWYAYERFVARTLDNVGSVSGSQEIYGLRQDGSVFPARVSIGLMHSGASPVFVCVVTDISAQVGQRTELRAARDHLLMAAEAAGLGIWTLDPLDQSLGWNERMFEIYGMAPRPPEQRLALQDWLDRLYPEDIERCRQALDNLLSGNGAYDLVFRARLPDGELRYIQGSARAERAADGTAQRVTGINRDITLQHELEATLRQAKAGADRANASKSAFLANMSHEIRTPLNAVLGMLQLVERTTLEPHQQDYIAKARQAARSLLGLLNDILDYSKIEANKLKLDVHAFDLDELLAELAVIIAGNQNTAAVEAVFDIDPTVPSILLGDGVRLKQVLVNLAGNALKFTLHGTVVIRLAMLERNHHDVTLRFTVEDTGIGISAEQRERIFDGFSQAETSTSRRFGGTGLGLVISNRLVTLMGGELQLDSQVGQGSRFWFELAFKAQDGGEIPQPPPGDALPLRLLIVDDNPTSAEVLWRTAQALGWQAAYVLSGEQAIQRVQHAASAQQPFDVVLMDWRMPTLDGIATAGAIQREVAQAQWPRFIMVTAYADLLTRADPAATQGLFATTLSKPVTPRQLRDCVLGIVQGRPIVRRSPALQRAPKRLAGLQVLVVEDNAVNRQVASGLLHLEGAHVTLASNGLEALAALAQMPLFYDAVLMDMQMPEMDGLEATRRIRLEPRFAALPIIAMTANASLEDRDACLAAGMNDHISKPMDLATLVNSLIHWVDQARSQQVSPPSPVDPDDLLEAWPVVAGRFGGDQDLLRNVLAIFLSDTRELLARLRQLARSGDRGAARAILHAIKGSAANVGAKAFALRVDQWEAGLEKGDREAVDALATGALAGELLALLEQSEAQMHDRR